MEEHMSSHGIRLGGWLLLIGGLLSAVTILLPYLIVGPGGPGGVPVVPINVLSIIGALLLIGGLPAFYACQAKQTGWVGLVGVVALGMTELLLVVLRFFLISLAISDTKGLPTSVLISILAVGIAQTISFIFLAIAIMRSRVFPIWLAWTLIASLVVGWVGFFLPNLVETVLLSISDLGELSLTLWLIVMGVNSERWKEQASAARASLLT